VVLVAPPKSFSILENPWIRDSSRVLFLPSLRISLHICEVGFRQFSGFF